MKPYSYWDDSPRRRLMDDVRPHLSALLIGILLGVIFVLVAWLIWMD